MNNMPEYNDIIKWRVLGSDIWHFGRVNGTLPSIGEIEIRGHANIMDVVCVNVRSIEWEKSEEPKQ